jgi:serine/threonine-protein kinase
MAEGEAGSEVGGSVAGRYEVLEVLGRGGMGAVYRVRDARGGRQLALKRGFARDPSKVERRKALLELEYYTLAQLAHPSIIEVYEYGVDDDGPFYTMELLDGADLDRRGRVPWQQACALLCDVASSLAILHARGLLHRDVSARNVRCTAAGRAKLIDFGAMSPMGVAKQIIGTPPFMAPEVLQMQELDARADLYALGALGYFMLTGRHAYPARRFDELRDMWRSRPTALSRLAPAAPQALVALIERLLMLDRNARPQTAAEVMERLCAIASLPRQEGTEVSRAYLARPVLVGRDRVLVELRRQMLSLVRGDGCSLLVEGVAGSGRSRVLDAGVLEGKLLGACVLRADTRDAARGDWGVARALGSQLFEALPLDAAEAAHLARDVLGHVIDEVRAGSSTPPAEPPPRGQLLRVLRDFVIALARVQRTVIVVDDVDAIDEPSAALLAALAYKADRNPLMLVLACDHEVRDEASGSLRLLRKVAHSVVLEQLEPAETEALMRSVFGDVANVQIAASHIHALCEGNPRAAMELAQHMVTRGIARYEAGAWSLPRKLQAGDLPSTLQGSLSRRLSLLSDDARELLDVFALAASDALVLADYPELTANGDRGRAFRALDELVAARMLAFAGDRYVWNEHGFVSVLLEQMPPERRRAIHARLADRLAQRGDNPVRLAYHLLHGGRERQGIELLRRSDLHAQPAPVTLLEHAIEHAERLGCACRTLCDLRVALMAEASLTIEAESFLRQFEPMREQLVRDSGLLAFEQLAHLPPSDRLAAALTRAQEHHLATPEHERGYAPIEAIRVLARLTGALCSLATQMLDIEMLSRLPSLAPFEPLSPAIAVVSELVAGARLWLRGRFFDCALVYERVLERIAQPDRGGFDDSQWQRTHFGVHYLLGLLEAALGIPRAEQHALVLERNRNYRVSAWRVRMLLHLNQGNVDEGRTCQRRAELAQLQESGDQRYFGMGANFEQAAFAELGDLIGVRNALEELEGLARRYPRWVPAAIAARARYLSLQGDAVAGLEALLPGFALAMPDVHPSYASLAGIEVRLLLDLGRDEEALERARHHSEVCERNALPATALGVGLAIAQARAGLHTEAVATIEQVIARAQAFGTSGLALGALFEARARIALMLGDAATFERCAERCAVEFRKAQNPALGARFARLIAEAAHKEVAPVEPAPEGEQLLQTIDSLVSHNTIRSRLLECVDEGDRARTALTLLLQSTDSNSGYLFGVRHGRVELIAGLPDRAPEPALRAWVEQCVHRERELSADAIATADEDLPPTHSQSMPPPAAARYVDAEGVPFEAILLIDRHVERGKRIAAVLALPMPRGVRSVPDRELMSEIASELLVRGDVSAVTADESVITREA